MISLLNRLIRRIAPPPAAMGRRTFDEARVREMVSRAVVERMERIGVALGEGIAEARKGDAR